MAVTISEWLGAILMGPWKSVLLCSTSFALAALFPFKLLHRAMVWPKVKEFRSILITGASSGIGAELARQYAAPGVRLVLTARRTGRLDTVKQECEASGALVEVVGADVTDEKLMAQVISDADDRLQLDLVIANAGLHPTSIATDQPIADCLIPTTSCDVMGVCYTIAPIVGRMQARGSGQIAIMASLSSFIPFGEPWWVAYSAAKAWARAYGMGLRHALRGSGVGVTVLCPGFVKTELADDLAASGMPMPCALSCSTAVARMRRAIGLDVAEYVTPWYVMIPVATMMYNVMPPFIFAGLPLPWFSKAGGLARQ